MSAAEEPLAHRRLRAPREHGQTLVQPSLAHVGQIVEQNRRCLNELSSGALRWLAELRQTARRQLVETAAAYTRQYRDASRVGISDATPLFLTGHQPQLFHAGVWFKNFVVSALARQHDAVAVNLIADNDILQTTAIRVPSGLRASPSVENVLLDSPGAAVPFEERAVLDPSQVNSFAQRVSQTIEPWIARPLVKELWPHVIEGHGRTNNLGQLVANARHALEGEWGLETLEVPLSTIYSQEPFLRFAFRLMAELGRFLSIYNDSLAEYRRVNRVRSRSHPVPDLEQQDDWLEAPLWVWSSQAPHRRRLFIRATGDRLELSDRGDLREQLPLSPDDAFEGLAVLQGRGIKIRPRALVTTMYARLVLSDLFVHGIGGAKYDELTDAMIRRYLELEPPGYLTVTATVELPLEYARATSAEVQAAERKLRDLTYHPERFLREKIPNESAADLYARKQQLCSSIPPRGERKSWHDELTALNHAMQPLVAPLREQANQQLAELDRRHRHTRLLGSREFSFCLFPSDFLRPLLLDLSTRSA